jgi:hypothetical protein
MQDQLNKQLDAPEIIREKVLAICNKPEHEKTLEERVGPKENIFLYRFALPEIFQHVLTVDQVDEATAKTSLRCEYFDKYPAFSSANAHRIQGHPFQKNYPFEKNLEEKITEIMDRWKRPEKSEPLNRAYPDLCLSRPFPYKIVFDAKFFEGSTIASAERALVTGVYEVAFYRGLPVEADHHDSGWDYDFGCLLAYDASPKASLLQAWNSVHAKRLFWDDANIFVMIIRGQRG